MDSIQLAQNSSTTSADFPFIYLHNEMVTYFQDRNKNVVKAREKWMEHLRHSDAVDIFTGSDTSLPNQIFSHKNAEKRLEAIGFRVGFVLAEKFSKDMSRFANELDRMKFICKEFWISTFGKGVNKLSTNHQGIYIIQDTDFCTLSPFSEGIQYVADCIPFTAFPVGIVRGALDNLGIRATVTVQVEKLPSVKFNVQLIK
uniref:Trafficking protein particle complex subunit 6B n=1 Tax=Meloidogyne hapla TaxID=6305 RepID=A0A1I8AZ28_MELHA